jgi:hypothetical protein
MRRPCAGCGMIVGDFAFHGRSAANTPMPLRLLFPLPPRGSIVSAVSLVREPGSKTPPAVGPGEHILILNGTNPSIPGSEMTRTRYTLSVNRCGCRGAAGTTRTERARGLFGGGAGESGRSRGATREQTVDGSRGARTRSDDLLTLRVIQGCGPGVAPARDRGSCGRWAAESRHVRPLCPHSPGAFPVFFEIVGQPRRIAPRMTHEGVRECGQRAPAVNSVPAGTGVLLTIHGD